MSIGLSIVIFFISIIALLAEIFLYFIFGMGAAFTGDMTSLTGVALLFGILMILTLTTGILAPICAIVEAIAKKKNLAYWLLLSLNGFLFVIILVGASMGIAKEPPSSSNISQPSALSQEEVIPRQNLMAAISAAVAPVSYRLEHHDADMMSGGSHMLNHIRFYRQFENKSDNTIVGLQYTVKFYDAFGELVHEFSKKDNIQIRPHKRNNMDEYTYWEENQFLSNQPYNKLFDCVSANLCKAEIEITQVVFENGQSIKL